MNQKGFSSIFIIVGLVLILLVGGIYYSKTRRILNVSTNQVPTAPITTQVTPIPTNIPDLNNSNATQWETASFQSLSFKIPPGYNYGYLGSPKYIDSSSMFVIDPQPIPQNPSYGDFTPAFTLRMLNKSLDQVKSEFQKIIGDVSKQETPETIDSHTAVLIKEVIFNGEDETNHDAWTLYIQDGDVLYVFGSYDLHISSNNQQKYFNQTMNSFTFTNHKTAQPGQHCGGFIKNAAQCITGYHCQLGSVPDTGGTCVKD